MVVRHLLTGFFVAVIVLNAMCPFVGIKWEYSMSMFSKLNYETSNHFFMPSSNPFRAREFYYVRSLDVPTDAPPSAASFRQLLERIGHLAALPANIDEAGLEAPPPISRNLLCYHISRLRDAGVPFAVEFRGEKLGPTDETPWMTISQADCPLEWTRFDLFSRYPPIKGDYSTITELLRERSK